ncbi:MAG: GNAT family N-acyltransferase [Tepidisphaeraceae bacterium]|jgi:putative hemolysin
MSQNHTLAWHSAAEPFSLSQPHAGRLRDLFTRTAERWLGLDGLNEVHAHATGRGGAAEFFRRALEDLHVSYEVPAEDVRRIPTTGPVVVVANHPFGGIEGVVLAAVLSAVRTDVKLMANYLLGRIPETREMFILVDPFGGESAARANLQPLRECLRHLKNGGVLGVFPAGEVSHLHWRTGKVEDPSWNPAIARIIRISGATVLPIYFPGCNGKLFQLAGLLHPRLRTAMLPRELLKIRGSRIDLCIGSHIPPTRTREFGGDGELIEFLRQRTYVMAHRVRAASSPATSFAPPSLGRIAVAGPTSPESMEAEVAGLPPEQLLLESGEQAVHITLAAQAPGVLREIGRLRELTFRAAGEGTGQAIDLDRYDNTYMHLFVWHRGNREVVGAYRIGRADSLALRHGLDGLYTYSLFNYGAELLRSLGPALELGRAFVRSEYQKSYAPLLLLWKGVARYVLMNPKYKCLMGPVSISSAYSPVSQQLMVQFLKARHLYVELQQMVRARNPFRPETGSGVDDSAARTLLNGGSEVSELVSEIEPDGKEIPVLLRQYLKLGAKFMAFNVDRSFNNAIDALMAIDLTRTDHIILGRYMGTESRDAFLAFHAGRPAGTSNLAKPFGGSEA